MSLPLLNKPRERVRLFRQMVNSVRAYPLLCISLLLYWVWQIAFLQSPVLSLKESDSSFAALFKGVILISSALSYLVLALSFKKTAKFAAKKGLLLAIAALMTGGSLAYVWATSGLQYHVLIVIVSAALIGVGAALFVVEMGRAFSQLGSQYSLYFGSISIVLGTLMYYLLTFYPLVLEVILIVIPSFAVYLLKVTLKSFSQTKLYLHGLKKKTRVPKKLIATTFVHGFGLGVIAGLLSENKASVTSPEVFILAFIVGAVILMLTAILLRMDFNHLVYQIAFPIMGLGFLLLTCIPHDVVIGGFVLTVGYCFMYTIVTCINAHFSHVLGYSPVWIVSLTTLFLVTGQIAGALLSNQIGSFAETSPTAIFVMCATMAFLMPVLALLLLSNSNPMLGWGAIKPSEQKRDTLEEAARRIAKDHHLTARETEVLLLLSRGRNKRYISKELTLAEETIKTHTGNIYSKILIHSQQELITLVEDASNMANNSME